MTSKIELGLIGAGRWGATIARTIIKNDLARISAIHDLDIGRAKKLGKELNADIYTSIDKIPIERLDGIIIAVSIDQLFKVSLRVMERNANIFIEKPVAENLKQVETIRRVSRRKGLIVFPGFIMRFDPTITHIYNSIKNRDSYIQNIYTYRLSRRPENLRHYSIVHDLAIHDIDIVNMLSRALCEPLRSFYGKINNIDQYFITYLKCNNVDAYIHVDGYSSLKIRKTITVLQDQVIEADSVLKRVYIRQKNSTNVTTVSVDDIEPLKREMEAFINIIRGIEIENIPTIDDALKAHIVIEKAVEKARDEAGDQ